MSLKLQFRFNFFAALEVKNCSGKFGSSKSFIKLFTTSLQKFSFEEVPTNNPLALIASSHAQSLR